MRGRLRVCPFTRVTLLRVVCSSKLNKKPEEFLFSAISIVKTDEGPKLVRRRVKVRFSLALSTRNGDCPGPMYENTANSNSTQFSIHMPRSGK